MQAEQPQSVKVISLRLIYKIIEHLFMIKICDLEWRSWSI